MGLLDMVGAQSPQPQGGLLGGMQQQGQGSGTNNFPPQLKRAIEQMRGASPEQKQEFINKVVQSIQDSPKDAQMKQQAISQFMAAMK